MICKKIGEDCFNREIVISDANFIINIMNFYYDTENLSLGKLLIKTSKIFFKICKYCAIFNKLYVSNLLRSEELSTLEDTSLRNNLKFANRIKKLNLQLLDCFLTEILRDLTASESNYLNNLEQIANRFIRGKGLSKISRIDLSLFLLGLKISIITKENVLLITDDLSLYLFVKEYNNIGEIEICKKKFGTNKIFPLLPLTYTLKMYEKCDFDDFLNYFDYLKEYYSNQKNPRNVKRRFNNNHEMWKQIMYILLKKT